MSFSLFSGDDERVPGADEEPGDKPSSRASSLPPEPATEMMTEVIETADMVGVAAGPDIEVGEGVELSAEELAAFDEELAAFDEVLDTLSDAPPGGAVIDDSDVESLPPTEHDSDFNEEIEEWVKTTVPPPAEALDEEALARLDRASDAALAELDDASEAEDDAPAEKFVPSRRRPDLRFDADDGPADDEPLPDNPSPPPPSNGSLMEGEPPSLRSLALASVPPQPSARPREREPGGDSIVVSSRGFATDDVSAPPPKSFFEPPKESTKPAPQRKRADRDTASARVSPPRRRRPAAPAASESPLPPPPREPRLGMATEARSAGGESVGTERPAETPRTSPWLTHLVALLIGAAATYVLLDLRSTNDARPSEPPTRASATPTDAEAGRQDPEAVDRGTDDEAEPSESAASTDAEETAAVPSSWEWPTTAPSVWPTASAVPEPSAAAEPSSAASSAEPGPFDPGAARSALGGLAVSASACGDGSMRGRARVAVTFANSGNATVALIQGGPLSGTSVGSCIANVMRSAKVPAYSGPITTVFTTVVVK